MTRLRLLLDLAVRRARVRPGRSALVSLGVGLGVALMVALRLLNADAAAALGSGFDRLHPGVDLSVMREDVGLAAALAERLEAVAGVDAALPVLEGTVFTERGDALTLLGLDLPHPRVEAVYAGLLEHWELGPEGRDALVVDGAVLISEELAARLGVGIGSVLRVEGSAGMTDLRVGGLLRLAGLGRALADQLIVADLDKTVRVLGRSGHVDRIDILGDGSRDAEQLAADIRAAVPEGARVGPAQSQLAFRGRLLEAFLAITRGVSVFGLVVGFFLIYNVLTAAILAEARHLARLRLQGASRRDLVTLVALETGLAALPGIAIGAVLGIIVAVAARGTFLEGVGNVAGMRLPADLSAVSWPAVLLVAALGLPTAMAAAWLAAHRNLSRAPLQAVTGAKGPEERRSAARLAQTVSAVLLVLAVAFVALEATRASPMFGMLAIGTISALLVTGTAALVLPATRVVRPLLMAARPAAQVAAEGLMRGWGRTVVTIAVLVLGIGTATATATIFESARALVLGVLRSHLRGDVVITSAFHDQGWLPMPIDGRLAARLRLVPGVRAVATERLIPVTFRGQSVTARAVGGDAEDGASDGRRWPFVGAPPFEALGGDAVFISRSLTETLGIRRGDPVELDGPDGHGAFRAIGVVEDYAPPGAIGSVIMDRTQVAALARDELVTYIALGADPNRDVAALVEDIRRDTGREHRLRVLSLQAFLGEAEGRVQQAFAFAHAATVVTLLIATAGLLQSLVSGALERQRVLAIMRAVGASLRHLRTAFVIEGTLVGVIGASLGLLAGVLLSLVWVGVHLRVLLGWSVPISWPWGTYALAGGLAVAWSALAARLVAWRLARLPSAADLVAE